MMPCCRQGSMRALIHLLHRRGCMWMHAYMDRNSPCSSQRAGGQSALITQSGNEIMPLTELPLICGGPTVGWMQVSAPMACACLLSEEGRATKCMRSRLSLLVPRRSACPAGRHGSHPACSPQARPPRHSPPLPLSQRGGRPHGEARAHHQ